MAKFRVQSIEERTDGYIACDTYVLNSDNVEIGHFTVLLLAADVLVLAGLSLAARVTGYKTLFASDPRIAQVTDSEEAVAQMEADVNFPVTVEL